jgi:hypothetical protein
MTYRTYSASVGNGSGEPASGAGLDWIDGSFRFPNRPITRTAAPSGAKPVPEPINPRVLPGLARPVGSNLQFNFSGISICRRILMSYCYVQNINSDTSLSFLVSLAAIIIKISQDILPATS